ncbi:MAG: DUF4234 domain-containing protein [Methanobrevibacter sp.]|nr:DUF4234 domain-containing protein [Methanobrevibacter sp.]
MEFQEKIKHFDYSIDGNVEDLENHEYYKDKLSDNSLSRNHVYNNSVLDENIGEDSSISLEDTSKEDINKENSSKEDINKENVDEKDTNGQTIDVKKDTIENKIDKSNNSLHSKEYSKAIPIRRLFLLMIFTLGIYGFYWYYKNCCYLRDEFNKDINPILRTILLIIPIVNIIFFYLLLRDMNVYIEDEGIESYSPILNTLIMIFLGGPSVVGMWVLINVQESFNEFWRIKENGLPIRREFNTKEIIVMAVTSVFIYFAVTIFFVVYILLAIYSGN